MPKITRLEWILLIITTTVLSVTITLVVGRRQQVPQDADYGSPGGELQAMAQRGAQDATEQDTDLPPSDEDREFFERVRDVPRPGMAQHAQAATNAIAGETVGGTNATAGVVPPPRTSGTNEIMEALARIAAMPWSAESEQLLQTTIAKWAATDPSAALEYALGIESRRVRAALVGSVLTSWAKTDFNGAYSWLMATRTSDPDTFRLGLKPVFSAAAAKGLPEAMRMAMELGTGPDRITAFGAVLGYASRSGTMPSMIAYLDTLPTVGERRSYASLLAQNWALYSPEEAAGWAQSLTDPQLKKAALSTAISMWAGDNPTAAAAWAMTLPDTELRSQQLAQITQSWAKYDPVKAADWLLSMKPPSPTLDPSVQSLVGTIMKSSPEIAVMWAGTISDPRIRTSTIMNVARQWMKNDPRKAEAYIATAPLTPAQRNALMRVRK